MLENVQFQLTNILQPTSFEIHKLSEGEYKKILYTDESVNIDFLAVKLDFKDIELLIFL